MQTQTQTVPEVHYLKPKCTAPLIAGAVSAVVFLLTHSFDGLLAALVHLVCIYWGIRLFTNTFNSRLEPEDFFTPAEVGFWRRLRQAHLRWLLADLRRRGSVLALLGLSAALGLSTAYLEWWAPLEALFQAWMVLLIGYLSTCLSA